MIKDVHWCSYQISKKRWFQPVSAWNLWIGLIWVLIQNMVIMSYWGSKHCKSTARFLQFEWAKMTSSMRIQVQWQFPIVRCHGPWTAAPGCSVPNAPPSVSGTPPPPPEGLGPQALRGPWQRSWWCK